MYACGYLLLSCGTLFVWDSSFWLSDTCRFCDVASLFFQFCSGLEGSEWLFFNMFATSLLHIQYVVSFLFLTLYYFKVLCFGLWWQVVGIVSYLFVSGVRPVFVCPHPLFIFVPLGTVCLDQSYWLLESCSFYVVANLFFYIFSLSRFSMSLLLYVDT